MTLSVLKRAHSSACKPPTMALHSGSRLQPINDHKLLAVIENPKLLHDSRLFMAKLNGDFFLGSLISCTTECISFSACKSLTCFCVIPSFVYTSDFRSCHLQGPLCSAHDSGDDEQLQLRLEADTDRDATEWIEAINRCSHE